MNSGYYINKKDGRKSYINDATIKIIGAANILKDWYEVDGQVINLPSVDEIIVPEEIKKVSNRLSISKLRDAVSEMTLEELSEYLDDDRSSAISIVEAELKRRSNADSE